MTTLSLSLPRACVGARDPYCGWDLLLKKCTTLEESVRMSQWEQSITKCPVSIAVSFSLIFMYFVVVLPLFFCSCFFFFYPYLENTASLSLHPFSLLLPIWMWYVHLCSSPLNVCPPSSPCGHNKLTLRRAPFTPGTIQRTASIIHLLTGRSLAKQLFHSFEMCTKFGGCIRGW